MMPFVEVVLPSYLVRDLLNFDSDSDFDSSTSIVTIAVAFVIIAAIGVAFAAFVAFIAATSFTADSVAFNSPTFNRVQGLL